MDLGATDGCVEAIACLEMHCNLLKGSTSKEVLEVFYQEVGIRLQQYVPLWLPGFRSYSGFYNVISNGKSSHYQVDFRLSRT
jgi:recyclin-1